MATQYAAGNSYVECDSCGHPIEDHNRGGCREPECVCAVAWTAAEIRRVRKSEGLS